jgi:phosphohistidine phosphatase SixA
MRGAVMVSQIVLQLAALVAALSAGLIAILAGNAAHSRRFALWSYRGLREHPGNGSPLIMGSGLPGHAFPPIELPSQTGVTAWTAGVCSLAATHGRSICPFKARPGIGHSMSAAGRRKRRLGVVQTRPNTPRDRGFLRHPRLPGGVSAGAGMIGLKHRQAISIVGRPSYVAGRSGRIVVFAFALLLGVAPSVSASEETALWRALASKGHAALLRHAIAPGTGDPSAFTIGDCATQRNLSEEGRRQAAQIGARFRKNGIEAARIFSSQWCRCLETAGSLGLGPVTELPILNSFFQSPDRRDDQAQELEEWLAGQDLEGSLVLVTHQVNITALTGIYPASGELIVIRQSGDGEISVVGSIRTD